MTTTKMTEQQRAIVINAIWKFSSAFKSNSILSTDENSAKNLLQHLGSLLLAMKKGYIVKLSNITDDEKLVVCKVDLPYLEITDKQLFDDWHQKGIRNEAYVATIPNNNFMDSIIECELSILRNECRENVYIFDFIDTIYSTEVGEKYYLNVYDLAISSLYSNYNRGEFIQPTEFGELASALLNVKGKDVFNPFAGLMSFATSLEGYNYFEGIEINRFICELNRYRLALAEIEDNTKCECGDVENIHWPTYSVIVSTPPIGIDINLTIDALTLKSEIVCLYKFDEWTFPNGELLTFVPYSVLYKGSNSVRTIREELTNNNYLDTIILLPSSLLLPYTSIAMAAIFLKKERDANAPVRMIDASSLYLKKKNLHRLDVEAVKNCFFNTPKENCALVSFDDIRENQYTWDVSLYLKSQNETFPKEYAVRRLGEIAKIIRGEMVFDEVMGHVADVSALSSDISDCIKPVEAFEYSDDLLTTRKISEPVILISSVSDLKPTYCEASKGKPIFVFPRVIALRVTNAFISPFYLCLELSRRPVPLFGNSIRHSVLTDIKIAFPSLGSQKSLVEQNNLFNEAMDNFRLAKAKELGLQDYIEKLKAEYISIVRTRKHDMMPYMRELGSIARRMRKYVENSGNPDLIQKTDNLLNLFDAAFKGLSELVNIFSQEDKFGTPEKVNIDKYLRDFVETHKDDNTAFTIDYYRDDNALCEYGITTYEEIANNETQLLIKIAPIDLDRMVRNILENAIVHGFTDVTRTDYRLVINLTVVPEKKQFQIDFSNNGTPLPKGMNKEGYGLLGEKAGKTGKTGQGGYIVKSIVEHFDGDYDVFCDGINTVISIYLPILNNFE